MNSCHADAVHCKTFSTNLSLRKQSATVTNLVRKLPKNTEHIESKAPEKSALFAFPRNNTSRRNFGSNCIYPRRTSYVCSAPNIAQLTWLIYVFTRRWFTKRPVQNLLWVQRCAIPRIPDLCHVADYGTLSRKFEMLKLSIPLWTNSDSPVVIIHNTRLACNVANTDLTFQWWYRSLSLCCETWSSYNRI